MGQRVPDANNDRVYWKDAPQIPREVKACSLPRDGEIQYVDHYDDESTLIHIYVWCHSSIDNVFWFTTFYDGAELFESNSVSALKIVGEEIYLKHRGNKHWLCLQFESEEAKQAELYKWINIKCSHEVEKALLEQ